MKDMSYGIFPKAKSCCGQCVDTAYSIPIDRRVSFTAYHSLSGCSEISFSGAERSL